MLLLVNLSICIPYIEGLGSSGEYPAIFKSFGIRKNIFTSTEKTVGFGELFHLCSSASLLL